MIFAPAVLLVFGAFEYSRSWVFYKARTGGGFGTLGLASVMAQHGLLERPANAATSSADNPLARLATSGGVDDLLAALKQVGTVEKVARQDVGGVATTKYHATIDASSFLKDLPAIGGTDLGGIASAVSAPVDLWVDDQGRLVRAEATVGSGDTGVKVSLGLAEFGTQVDVTAPSVSLDLGNLLQGLGG